MKLSLLVIAALCSVAVSEVANTCSDKTADGGNTMSSCNDETTNGENDGNNVS